MRILTAARRMLIPLVAGCWAWPLLAGDMAALPPIESLDRSAIGSPDLFRWSPSLDETQGSPIGEIYHDRPLTLDDGRQLTFSALQGNRMTLVAVRDPGCPVSRRYAPRLAGLQAGGLNIVYLLSGGMATPGMAGTDRERHGLRGAYLLDQDQSFSAWLGTRSTGDVFLFDRTGRLRYRGAIDDQYGIGFTRPTPTRTFLNDAMVALRAGRAPGIVATVAPGCVLQKPVRRSVAADPPATWHGKVSRIVQAKCQKCHRPGQAAPFALLSYEDVALRAPMIRFVLERHIMPPWFASGDPAVWQGEYHLDPADRQFLIDWIDAGAPRGDPDQAPPPMDWQDGWLAGEPDQVLESDRLLEIPAEGNINYRYIEIETGFAEDRWVEAIEVRSDRPQNAHHILVALLPPKQKDRIFAVLDPDQDHELSDWEKTELATRGFFGIYGPGTTFIRYPEGLAKRLPKGWRLLFQVHYEPNGESAVDRPRIGLHFAAQPPRSVVSTLAASNLFIIVPPHKKGHIERAGHRFKQDGELLAFLPHMHLRGQAFRYEIERADGTRETLLDVPRYDPNWQYLYQLRQPIPVKSGERMIATAWFDNSASNPLNPDPSDRVMFGQQISDEMLIGYFDIVTTAEDEPGRRGGR